MIDAGERPNDADIVTKLSRRTVSETASRLEEILESRGIRLFAVIDQSAEAGRVGLRLRETTLLVFGSPMAGTPVMVASPLAALDLPLKVLIWADDGQTKVTYYSPAAIADRHHLSPDLAEKLTVVDTLTNALVAP